MLLTASNSRLAGRYLSLKTGDTAWTFTGECDGLITDDATVLPSPRGATEVQYVIPRQHRASLFLARFVTTPRPDGGIAPEYTLDLGEATLRFRFDRDTDLLTIFTLGSDLLPLTLTESWLGEPLRILFGQLVFPRLTARCFPTGGDDPSEPLAVLVSGLGCGCSVG
jgi:hypothetical protein